MKHKQCIIIVERRFTADRSPKAADASLVERGEKRGTSLLPPRAPLDASRVTTPLPRCLPEYTRPSFARPTSPFQQGYRNAVTISRDLLLTQEVSARTTPVIIRRVTSRVYSTCVLKREDAEREESLCSGR